MKKFLTIMILMSTMFLVGCVNADVTVDLERNGTGKAMIQLLGPNIVFDNIPQSFVNDLGKNYESVEKLKENNQTGYKFTTKQGPIDEVLKDIVRIESLNEVNSNKTSTDGKGVESTEVGLDNVNLIDYAANEMYKKYVKVQESNSLFSTTYHIDVRLRDAIYSEINIEHRAVMALLGKSTGIGLHLKSPIKAESSNATSVIKEDGKHVYNWDYTLSDVQNINFSVKIPNIKNIAMIAGAVLLVIIISFMIGRGRKKSNI